MKCFSAVNNVTDFILDSGIPLNREPVPHISLGKWGGPGDGRCICANVPVSFDYAGKLNGRIYQGTVVYGKKGKILLVEEKDATSDMALLFLRVYGVDIQLTGAKKIEMPCPFRGEKGHPTKTTCSFCGEVYPAFFNKDVHIDMNFHPNRGNIELGYKPLPSEVTELRYGNASKAGEKLYHDYLLAMAPGTKFRVHGIISPCKSFTNVITWDGEQLVTTPLCYA
jgi:hypothetical protein